MMKYTGKTDIFGLLIKAKTGRTPDIMRVDIYQTEVNVIWKRWSTRQ